MLGTTFTIMNAITLYKIEQYYTISIQEQCTNSSAEQMCLKVAYSKSKNQYFVICSTSFYIYFLFTFHCSIIYYVFILQSLFFQHPAMSFSVLEILIDTVLNTETANTTSTRYAVLVKIDYTNIEREMCCISVLLFTIPLKCRKT